MGLFNNFPYPDTHQLNLDWILDAVKRCIDNVAESEDVIQKALTDAQAAATTAETSATSAQESASNAQMSVTQAQTYANTAQTSATSARESASSAQAIATELTDIFVNNAGAHNAIYRGKSLGSTVTTAQYAAIKAGTFKDLYIGDYWTIGGVNYRIAAFDYYLNSGDVRCTTHHVVIVPDTSLYNHAMNDTNITTGGYVGSKMYTDGLEQAKTTIKAAFSGHVLSHRVYLTNVVTDGHPSSGAWCDSEVNLMDEQMVYGGAIFMPIANGSTAYTNYRVEKSQLPLFAHEPSRICNRDTWWLRDVVTASTFAVVGGSGDAYYLNSGTSFGVRPAFCIS